MGEIAFENWFCDEMKKRGWINRKMAYIGRRGCADRYFFKDGKVLMVELKTPTGTTSKLQTREHAKLFAAGFYVHVIACGDDAWPFFRKFA